MNKERPVSDLCEIFPEMLENSNISFCPRGSSMLPTIRPGDNVLLAKPENLCKYDIVLYKRDDGKAVLHRIISVQKDGSYVMRGDNQRVKEFGITDKHIIAKVVQFETRGKKNITSRFSFKIDFILMKCIRFIKKIIKKIIRVFK